MRADGLSGPLDSIRWDFEVINLAMFQVDHPIWKSRAGDRPAEPVQTMEGGSHRRLASSPPWARRLFGAYRDGL